jgi:hypothetical protein
MMDMKSVAGCQQKAHLYLRREGFRFCESFHIDPKMEYNYAGRGLMVHEERISIHAIRKGVTACKPGTIELSKPAFNIHAIPTDSSCKIGRKSPYLKQKENSTVRKGHPDEGNPY